MTQNSKVEPSSNPVAPAQLASLNEYTFEEMCCALLDAQPHIKLADLFGTRGEAQYGIDIIAHREDGCIDVGQCKRYTSFSAAKIDEAAKKFIEHWESYWGEQDVNSFILFVSADLSSLAKQKSINKWKSKFQELGVNFEAWSERIIEKKLRAHVEIVARYFDPPEYWVKKLCGTTLKTVSSFNTNPLNEVGLAQIQIPELNTSINNYAEQEINRVRQLYSQGKSREALQSIESIKKDSAQWEVLEDRLKSQVLRLEANFRLVESNDIVTAKKLADEADSLYRPTTAPILRTLIAWVELGPQQALVELGEAKSNEDQIFKANLLIALSKIEEAESLLTNLDVDDDTRAEQLRIKSLIKLHRSEIEPALICGKEALKLKPSSRAIRETYASLLFYSSLSPIAIPTNLMMWPEPIDWFLVKQDNNSLQNLAEAELIFSNLLKECDYNKEQKMAYEGWKLACMCCDRSKLDAAEKYARSLIEQNNIHFQTIVWSISRGLLNSDEWEDIKEELIRKVAIDEGKVSTIIGLSAIYFHYNEKNKAHELLLKTKKVFESQNEMSLWEFWFLQASDYTQNTNINSFPDLGDRIDAAESVLIEKKAVATDDNSGIVEIAQKALNGEVALRLLVEACGFLSRREDWEYIADNAREIVNVINTADALETTIRACYYTSKYGDIIELIQNHQSLFQNGNLPIDVHRVKVYAQHMTGELASAIQEATSLAQQTGSQSDWIHLAELYINKGDLHEVSKAVRYAKRENKLSPEQALHFSRVLTNDDPELSKKLFLEATSQDLKPDYLPAAFYQSLNLGVAENDALNSLIAKHGGFDKLPGVQAVSIDEMIEFVKSSRLRSEQHQKDYLYAKVPIHIFSKNINITLAHFYHDFLTSYQDSESHISKNILLARYGGRVNITEFPDDSTELPLYLDITSLLLSRHLGILSEIERIFKILYVPSEVMFSLHQMRDLIIPSQSDILEAKEQVIRAYKNNNLYSFSNNLNNSELANVALSVDGVVLDWSKVNREKFEEEFPKEQQINCLFMAEQLLKLGALSVDVYESSKKHLGNEGVLSIGGNDLQYNTSIICTPGTLVLMCQAGLLAASYTAFNIYISEEEIKTIENDLDAAKNSRELASWLESLRDHISRGIDEGYYRFLPVNSDDSHQQDSSDDYVVESIKSLIESDTERGYLLCDDRRINSYTRIGNKVTLSIYDVLNALKHYGAFDEKIYYKYLDQLRKGNVFFIPLDRDEIVYHLTRTIVENSSIRETPELKTIRKYYAFCFGSNSFLINPDLSKEPPEREGEFLFSFAYDRAVCGAITDVWMDQNSSVEVSICRANWIVENLFAELIYPEPIWINDESDRFTLMSIQYGSLLTNALSIATEELNNEKDLQLQYLDWVYGKLIKHRITANPELSHHIYCMIKRYLVEGLIEPDDENDEENEGDLFRIVVRKFIRKLPKSISSLLFDDAEVAKRIGLSGGSLIPIGKYYFDTTEFEAVSTKAIEGYSSVIHSWDKKNSFLVSAEDIDNPEEISLLFKSDDNLENFRVTSPENVVLYASFEKIVEYLSSIRNLFDIPLEEFIHVSKNIAKLDSPLERIKQCQELLGNSCTYYYSQTKRNFEAKENFQLEELYPPSGEAMLRYLRLTENGDYLSQIEQSAHSLLTDLGIVEALRRFSGLPSRLPKSIEGYIEKLTEEEKSRVFNEWRESIFTPISLFNFVHYALKYACWDKNELSELVEDFLSDPDRDSIVLTYLSMLKWMVRKFSTWKETRSLNYSLQLALAWSHTHQIISIFLSFGAPSKDFYKNFENQQNRISIKNLLDESLNGSDVADPESLSQELLIVFGVGHSVKENVLDMLTDLSKEKLQQIMTSNIDGVEYPIHSLMRDTSLASNRIGSFYQADIGICFKELDEKYDFWYSQRALKQLVIDQIETGKSISTDSWAIYMAVMYYRKIYHGLYSRLEGKIVETNLTNIWKNNQKIGSSVLIFSTELARKSSSLKLREHVIKHIYDIAKLVEPQDYNNSDEKNSIEAILLSAIFNIALAEKSLVLFIEKLCELTLLLINILPSASAVGRPLYQIVYEDLPMDVSKLLRPLINDLRSS